jgi:hypothetical protein
LSAALQNKKTFIDLSDYPRLGLNLAAFSLLFLNSAQSLGGEENSVTVSFHGLKVTTSVDSELAMEYAAQFMNPKHIDPRFKALEEVWDAKPLGQGMLGELAAKTSTDFATLYFVRRIEREPVYAPFQKEFRKNYLRRKSGSITSHPEKSRYTLMFVPGFQYLMDPSTGADLAAPRELLARTGFTTQLVAIDEEGEVYKNARIIARAISAEKLAAKRVIIVSTSKSGLEVAIALGQLIPHHEVSHVAAWFSIGGLLRGTRLADKAETWPLSWGVKILFWFKGMSTDAITGMRESIWRKEYETLDFPKHILKIQYIGAPLSGQMKESYGYEMLAEDGPNDGLTYLADELIDGGHAVCHLGLDHFFHHPSLDIVTLGFIDSILAFDSGKSL